MDGIGSLMILVLQLFIVQPLSKDAVVTSFVVAVAGVNCARTCLGPSPGTRG